MQQAICLPSKDEVSPAEALLDRTESSVALALFHTHKVPQQMSDANDWPAQPLLAGWVIAASNIHPQRRTLGLELFDCEGVVGGPDRDRTDDLFHAMERPKT